MKKNVYSFAMYIISIIMLIDTNVIITMELAQRQSAYAEGAAPLFRERHKPNIPDIEIPEDERLHIHSANLSALSTNSRRRDSNDSECAICLEEIQSAVDEEEITPALTPKSSDDSEIISLTPTSRRDTILLTHRSDVEFSGRERALSVSAADESLLCCPHGEHYHAECMHDWCKRNRNCPECRAEVRSIATSRPRSRSLGESIAESVDEFGTDVRDFFREFRRSFSCGTMGR